MAAENQNELSVKQTVDPLKKSDGKSSRRLAAAYGIGRTRVQNILKRKHEIMEGFKDNGSSSRKRQCVSTANTDINDLMRQRFLKLRGQHIPVGGPMMLYLMFIPAWFKFQ